MHRPLVSIIMPASNVEQYIGAAIDSVIAQAYPNWELLVVINNNQDGTERIARTYTDSRIRILNSSTRGQSSARNYGLNQMRGEFICFLDGDDLLPKNSISARIEMFLENPELCFIDGHVKTMSFDLQNQIRHWKPSFEGNPHHEMSKMNPRCFCAITWLIRKTPEFSARFNTEWHYLEDRLFFLDISTSGNYAFTSEEVYIIRRRSKSLMSNAAAMEASFLRFINECNDRGLYTSKEYNDALRYYHSIFFRTYAKSGHLFKALKHWMKS